MADPARPAPIAPFDDAAAMALAAALDRVADHLLRGAGAGLDRAGAVVLDWQGFTRASFDRSQAGATDALYTAVVRARRAAQDVRAAQARVTLARERLLAYTESIAALERARSSAGGEP